jgi:patatin-like phospholipase/acyl hydrolase
LIFSIITKKGFTLSFKILTLDGGGVKGYLTILILEKLEKALQRKFNDNKTIGERFDLIIGTSTGGIIASGLSIKKSAKEIRILYEKLLEKIFTPHKKGFMKPKYNQNILKKELKKILGDKTLNDVDIHLCLTSTDISTTKPRFFKSPYKDIYKQRSDETLIDAVLATSAAPVFFPLVKTKHSNYLADGGLVANNPAMVGVIEGHMMTNDISKIKILSIGTGEIKYTPYDVKQIEEYGGIFTWALNSKYGIEPLMGKKMIIPLIEILLNAQSNLINAQASSILGDNFYRINPTLPKAIDIDDIDDIDVLKNLAIEADREKVINKVFNLLE